MAKQRVQNPPHGNAPERIALGSVLAKQAPSSAFIQGDSTLKTACDNVVNAGVTVEVAFTSKTSIQAQLDTAGTVLRTAEEEYDGSLGVLVALIESKATTAAQVQETGLSVFKRKSHPLLMPLLVLAAWEAAIKTLKIEVKQPPGMRACIVEISTDPSNPASWKRVEGDGIRRLLTGYAPGLYYVRVANTRAHETSAFTEPVSVLVT